MDIITLKTSTLQNHGSDNYDLLKQGDTYALFIKKAHTYKIEIDTDSKFDIIVQPSIKCNVLIEAKNLTLLNYKITLEKDSEVHVLLFNDSINCKIEESYHINEGAILYSGFGELLRGTSTHKVEYNIVGRQSKVEGRYAYICDEGDQKINDIKVHHLVGDSYANVELYGVVKKKATLKVDIASYIAKGAIQSTTHQASRVLTFDNNVNAKISPMLYIDENDVKASHACTLGSIDENHLYYLQSRGLSYGDAINLIVSGYLSILSAVFDEEPLIEAVNAMVFKKAGE